MVYINKIILNGKMKEVNKMTRHTIFLASAYSVGRRIAMDFPNIKDEVYDNVYKKIVDKCGSDINLSVHNIPTDNDSWKSVVKHDAYFKDVKLIKDLEEFINLIYMDRDLTGLDVAKYIISLYPCTHLKLEKLTYFCYADYLCNTGKKLFIDKIYAYPLGPVIKSVSKSYKNKKNKQEEDNKTKYNTPVKKMPHESRILASRDGIEKSMSIKKTLTKYASYSPQELVDLTHKENTPWSLSLNRKYYNEINDSLILDYHKNEII